MPLAMTRDIQEDLCKAIALGFYRSAVGYHLKPDWLVFFGEVAALTVTITGRLHCVVW